MAESRSVNMARYRARAENGACTDEIAVGRAGARAPKFLFMAGGYRRQLLSSGNIIIAQLRGTKLPSDVNGGIRRWRNKAPVVSYRSVSGVRLDGHHNVAAYYASSAAAAHANQKRRSAREKRVV